LSGVPFGFENMQAFENLIHASASELRGLPGGCREEDRKRQSAVVSFVELMGVES
jgi:hypothetical protein